MKVCSECGRCYDEGSVTFCVDDGGQLAEGRAGRAGEVVRGYTLERLTETRARVETYFARQNETGHACQVKIVPGNADLEPRFEDEAKLAVRFIHPNVADVYEAGRLDTGEFYIAAEAAEGRTLREILQSGKPDPLDTIEIMRQAAEALHALHIKGIVHRAVRPENIALSQDGDVTVRLHGIDLGGAEEHASVSNKFLLDTAIDSIRYFAPEQFDAEGETTARADIYSLGVVFFELLAGQPPFDATKATALIEKHRHQQPPELKIHNYDLRMLIGHTLLESLGKQPFMRQSTALAFARQLRHIEQLATHTSGQPNIAAPLHPVKVEIVSPAQERPIPRQPAPPPKPRNVETVESRPLQAAPPIPEIAIDPVREHAPREVFVPGSIEEPPVVAAEPEVAAFSSVDVPEAEIKSPAAVARHEPRPTVVEPATSTEIETSAPERLRARTAAASASPSKLQAGDDNTVFVPALGRSIRIKFDSPDDETPAVETRAFKALSRNKGKRPKPEPAAEPAAIEQTPIVAEAAAAEPAPAMSEAVPVPEPETVTAIAAAEPDVAEIPAVEAAPKPKKVVVEMSDDDIPSEAAVRAELERETRNIGYAAESAVAVPASEPLRYDDIHEIEVERPERTHTSDVYDATRSVGLANEEDYDYLPATAAPAMGGYTQSPSGGFGGLRLMAIGALLLAGVVVYLASGLLIGRSDAVAGSAPVPNVQERKAPPAIVEKAPVAAAAVPPARVEQKAVAAVNDPFAEQSEPPAVAETVNEKPRSVQPQRAETPATQKDSRLNRQAAVAEPVMQTQVTTTPRTQRAAVSSVPAPTFKQGGPVGSSVVITYDKDKARSGSGASIQTRRTGPGDGSTRPRIVPNPR